MRAARFEREERILVLVLIGSGALLFIHCRVVLRGCALARLAECLDKAAVEALDRKEYQQHQQHGHSPVEAERIFKPNGDKPADNAAALQSLSLLKQRAAQRLHIARIRRAGIEKEAAEGGGDDGYHQRGGHAQGDGLPLMEAENNRRHQERRHRQPEAPADEPLYEVGEKDDELAVGIEMTDNDEHRQKEEHDRTKLPPYRRGWRLRLGDDLGRFLPCACFFCLCALLCAGRAVFLGLCH